MKTIALNFKFKGNRKYVHGPDIYNQMMEHATAVRDLATINRIKLVIHAFASHQCLLMVSDMGESFDKPGNLIADLTLVTSKGNMTAALVETTEPINDTYSFDEGIIEDLCVIKSPSIEIKGDSGYSSIEVAVSMTKQLHNRLFPQKDGKWIVTGYDFTRLLTSEDGKALTVVFKHNFNNRLTKSELSAKGQTLGHIFFSLVPK